MVETFSVDCTCGVAWGQCEGPCVCEPDTDMVETFSVECTDGDATGEPRVEHYSGFAYFPARDAFVAVATLFPEKRYILTVGTDTRARVLSDSDTDNLVRVNRGLEAL